MWSRLNPALLALSALCIALAVVLGIVVLAPLPDTPVAAAEARSEPADDTPLPRFDPPSARAFATVDERLVFNPLRVRISAPFEPGAANASSLPSDLALVGVILDDTTRLALFKSPAAPLAVGVPVGGSIEGWQVTRIDADSVALRAGGPEQEMSLSANKAPPQSVSNRQRMLQPRNFVRPPNMVRNGVNQNVRNNNQNGNNNNDDDSDDDN